MSRNVTIEVHTEREEEGPLLKEIEMKFKKGFDQKVGAFGVELR